MSERRRPTQSRTGVSRPQKVQKRPAQEEHEVRKNIARPVSSRPQQLEQTQSERRQAIARPSTTLRPSLDEATAQSLPRPTHQSTLRPSLDASKAPQAKRPTNDTPKTEPVARPRVVPETPQKHHTIHSGESVQEKMMEAFKESAPKTSLEPKPRQVSKPVKPVVVESAPTVTINRDSYDESLRHAEEEIQNIPLDDFIRPVLEPVKEVSKEELNENRQRIVEGVQIEDISKAMIEKVVERPVKASENDSHQTEPGTDVVVSNEEASESVVENVNEDIPNEKEESVVEESDESGEDATAEEADKKKKKKKDKKPLKKKIFKWVLSLAILIGIFTGLRVSGVFATEVVIGTSMEPNYHTRDLTITSNLKGISRYDVVVATSPSGTEVIKRVIGMPGDTITYKNRHVYVNGVLTDETFINSGEEIELNMSGKIELGDNEYFLVGDNRENSSDSRIYGPVSGDQIHGTVLVRIPLSFQF